MARNGAFKTARLDLLLQSDQDTRSHDIRKINIPENIPAVFNIHDRYSFLCLSSKRQHRIPKIRPVINAILELTFAQKQIPVQRVKAHVFFSPGFSVLFFIAFAVAMNANGNKDVSATSIELVPWIQTGLDR